MENVFRWLTHSLTTKPMLLWYNVGSLPVYHSCSCMEGKLWRTDSPWLPLWPHSPTSCGPWLCYWWAWWRPTRWSPPVGHTPSLNEDTQREALGWGKAWHRRVCQWCKRRSFPFLSCKHLRHTQNSTTRAHSERKLLDSNPLIMLCKHLGWCWSWCHSSSCRWQCPWPPTCESKAAWRTAGTEERCHSPHGCDASNTEHRKQKRLFFSSKKQTQTSSTVSHFLQQRKDFAMGRLKSAAQRKRSGKTELRARLQRQQSSFDGSITCTPSRALY